MQRLRQQEMDRLRLLDVFCGLGGVSDGFALEGFDVLGIDIEDMPSKGYKHPFIQADIRDLKGEDFRGYDVIWGSPPCRDFSSIGRIFGFKWKESPNPEKGLDLIYAFLNFIEEAKPKFWIMENVGLAKSYVELEPEVVTYTQRGKRHCFWGNFPAFLMPRINKTMWNGNPRQNPINPMTGKRTRVLRSWIAAKIPLVCSRAFAVACREALEEKQFLEVQEK